MNTSIKHRSFVTEPAGEKPVTDIAGIGPISGKRLALRGYKKAIHVVGKYLVNDGNPYKFREFLEKRAHANKKHADDAFECVKEYTDNFNKSMDNNRGTRKSSQQMEILLKFMEKNPDIAKGKAQGDKVELEEKWREVTNTLNKAGPPSKDVIGWKRNWADWKCNVKKKISKKDTLNEQEERLARICGIDMAVDGISNCQSFGVSSSELNVEPSMSQNPIQVQDTIESEESVKSMMKSQNESIIKILSKIEETHSDSSGRIRMALESIDAYICEIQKQFKKHHETVEKTMVEKNEIKKQMLEIEKKKFEMYRTCFN